jgi:hypothetical protein
VRPQGRIGLPTGSPSLGLPCLARDLGGIGVGWDPIAPPPPRPAHFALHFAADGPSWRLPRAWARGCAPCSGRWGQSADSVPGLLLLRRAGRQLGEQSTTFLAGRRWPPSYRSDRPSISSDRRGQVWEWIWQVKELVCQTFGSLP